MMKSSIKTFSISALAVLALAAHERPAHALMAEGDVQVPGFAGGGAMADFDLCTYSVQTVPALIGPNNMHGGLVTQFAPGGPPRMTPIPPSDCSAAFMVDMRGPYAPLKGFRDRPKPPVQPAGNKNVTTYGSTSGNYFGFAAQDRNPPPPPPPPPPNPPEIRLQAFGARLNPALATVGEAAGQAIDPSFIPPGDYDYVQIIGSILLQTDREGDFAGVDMFAFDSRFSEPLWELQVFVEGGPITAVTDIEIDFISNPILGLTDDVIEFNVLSAFDVSDGIATLTLFELFDTTYPVDETILFTTGVEAAVEDVLVPEPSSPLSLLAIGIGGLGLSLKRKFKQSKSTDKDTTKVG